MNKNSRSQVAAPPKAWWKRKRAGAVLAAVILAIGGIVAALVTSDGDGPTRTDQSNCVINGNDNNVACPTTAAPSDPIRPSVHVVQGPTAETWSLQIRNFEPNSTVTLKLTDSAGDPQELGQLRLRDVDAEGNYDTARSFWFWRHDAGEPTGQYVLTVSGTDRKAMRVTRRATFEVN